MAKFLLLYHGGDSMENSSAEEQQQTMAAWGEWFASAGSAVVDPGNPVGQAVTISPDGTVTQNGGSNPASGYSVIEAESMQAASEIAIKCPHLKGGATLQLCETFNVM